MDISNAFTKNNNGTRCGVRLRSLLPKVLLYDNVSLTQKLNREVTCIAVDERKSAFNWAQMQRRFITNQALKQELHGMNLFPQINNSKFSSQRITVGEQQPLRAKTMIELPTMPPVPLSPTTQVARENTVPEFTYKCLHEPKGVILPPSRPARRRRPGNPLRDTRYVQLHGLLTELPLTLESRLYVAN